VARNAGLVPKAVIAPPHWSSPAQMCVLILRGATFRTASRIALVVGTLLTAVNQGAAFLSGTPGVATWLRTVANFLIPYTVASIGYLSPFRRTSGAPLATDEAVSVDGAEPDTREAPGFVADP
jgi:hypothetical protein